MARERALLLCISMIACNHGGAQVSATQAGFGTLDPGAGGSPTGGTTTAVEPTATGDHPADPTSGPSGVTAVSGADATGGDATGNDASGGDATGSGGTGPPDPGDTTGEAGTTAATASAGETAGPDAGTTDAGVEACVVLKCGGKTYDCGDCIDNDGDGKVDQADPECVSPCDDREDTFATGIPGDNVDPCKQDCFFDGNSGAGGGDCQWNLKCDPANPGGLTCPHDPNYKNCPADQSQECMANCQVPNGCDCFGCCAVTVDGTTYEIFLNDPDCSLDQIGECAKCTMNVDCDNPCDPDDCELCFGEEGLPPGCDEPSCPPGQDPCEVDDEGGSGCEPGFFCSTGCCLALTPG